MTGSPVNRQGHSTFHRNETLPIIKLPQRRTLRTRHLAPASPLWQHEDRPPFTDTYRTSSANVEFHDHAAAACCDVCICFHVECHFALSTHGSYQIQPTLRPGKERAHTLILTAGHTYLIHLRPLAEGIVICGHDRSQIKAVAAHVNTGSWHYTFSRNNTKKFQRDCGFSQRSVWTCGILGCDTVQSGQKHFGPMYPSAVHTVAVRFSKGR
jgi:hypothetical protein